MLPFGCTGCLIGMLPERHLYQKDAGSGAEASGDKGSDAHHFSEVGSVLIVVGKTFYQQYCTQNAQDTPVPTSIQPPIRKAFDGCCSAGKPGWVSWAQTTARGDSSRRVIITTATFFDAFIPVFLSCLADP